MINKKALVDVTTYIKRGITPKYVESNGIIVINQKCIREHRINYELARLTSREKKITEEKLLKSGDILINSTGTGTLGRTAQIFNVDKDITVDTHVTIVRPSEDIDARYLGYVIRVNESLITSLGKGATNQIELSVSDLEKINFNVPSKEIQKKISNILSSYDYLIENNLKRIKRLEESAEIIYREWFINLRFPGYEKCNIVDGIPEGWNTKLVKEFGEVTTGKTPSTKRNEYYGGDIPFIKTPDMSDVHIIKTNQSLTQEGAKSQESKYVPKNTILVSCIGTVGVVSLTSELSQFNQQINGLIPKYENYLYYMYFKFKSLKEYLEALGSSGATMLNVNKGKFENIEVLEPPKEVLDKFTNICNPIFDNILNIQHQNEKLKEARDILIPRLISGEIEV